MAGACLYNNSCWPCRSALNSPYSSRYLAFRLPSRMPSPALRGPRAISRCIINRSAAAKSESCPAPLKKLAVAPPGTLPPR
jgi:hypothetical protein